MTVYALLDANGTIDNVIVADAAFVAEFFPAAVKVGDGPGAPGIGWSTPDGGATWTAPAGGP